MKWVTSIAAIVLPIISILLFVSQIICTNNLAEDGATLKEISAKIDALSYDSEKLEQQIASASSLTEIQKRAVDDGFIEAKQFLTLAQGKYLVSLNKKR